jgi:hypothetical protein
MWLLRDITYSSFVTILLFSLVAFSTSSFAQVRSSTNYQLQSDSINVGGGLSDSASYGLESTVGEVATGRSSSTNFQLRAGYQQMQEVFLSLTPGADVVMSPDLPGLTGGTSNGSTTFTVITDSPAGYQVTLQAENDPAMQKPGGVSIANYNSGSSADFTFTIPPASAVFGFSPEGVDVADAFLDNTTTCGVGSTETAGACWAGASTTAVIFAEATSPNQPTGATTTIAFQVGLANGANIESGVYTATTTLTALPL